MPHYDISMRAAVLTLMSVGGKTSAQAASTLGMSKSQVNRIYAEAIKRGFDPNANPLRLEDTYVVDKPGRGRKTKVTADVQDSLLRRVCSSDGRNETLADLARHVSKATGTSISPATIRRILRKQRFRRVNPTPKPGLTQEMKAARLAWCKEREHWTLEDWKKVIWTDETSIILRYWKGSFKVWRRPFEKYDKTCIRRRFKGGSEFMFWAAFSYDQKGPCFCWPRESKKEKEQNDRELEALNSALEPTLREEWELNHRMARVGLRNRPGPRPRWRFTAKTGKLERHGTGGIDWFRYQKHVLKPLLFPFARQCLQRRPDTLVMEDNAPPHAYHFNRELFRTEDISCLFWPGNSPDLNPIEPVWRWMKRHIRDKYRPKTRAEAEATWPKVWEELPQEVLQQFVERMERHVKEVIRLDGGNEYREGRFSREDDNWIDE